MLSFGCHYNSANIIIRNETNKKIWYSTLAKDIDNTFYDISGGGQIESHGSDSPPVRGSSEGFRTDVNSYPDKSIYIAFYPEEIFESVNKNIDSTIKAGKIKVIKFSKKELDSLDWTIIYTEK
jgi:hypothetical protein